MDKKKKLTKVKNTGKFKEKVLFFLLNQNHMAAYTLFIIRACLLA